MAYNCNYDDFLIEMQKRINRIENSDSDFRNNPLWKKYRKKQDIAYALKEERER